MKKSAKDDSPKMSVEGLEPLINHLKNSARVVVDVSKSWFSPSSKNSNFLTIPMVQVAIASIVVFFAITYFGRTNKIIPPKASEVPLIITLSPGADTMPPDSFMKVNFDASTNLLTFASIFIDFDNTKIRLANEITVTDKFKTVITKTTMADANDSGRIEIRAGVAPGDIANPPTGSFEFANFPIAAISQTDNDQASFSVDTGSSQVANLNIEYVTISSSPVSITLNPVQVPTPTQGAPTPTEEVIPPTPTEETVAPTPTEEVVAPTPTDGDGTGGSDIDPTQTPVPTNTPKPTNTPVLTNTPQPTNTPKPTNTPVPTPTDGDGGTGGTDVSPTSTPTPTSTPIPPTPTKTSIVQRIFRTPTRRPTDRPRVTPRISPIPTSKPLPVPPIKPPQPEYAAADVNRDGKVNSRDVAYWVTTVIT